MGGNLLVPLSDRRDTQNSPRPAVRAGRREIDLPVFNPLAYDGGRCQRCQQRPQDYMLALYGPRGGSKGNQCVCSRCAPWAEAAILRKKWRIEIFPLGQSAILRPRPVRQLAMFGEEK